MSATVVFAVSCFAALFSCLSMLVSIAGRQRAEWWADGGRGPKHRLHRAVERVLG